MSLRLALLVAAAVAVSGCVSLCPVDTTPEDITGNIQPGDTVRIKTRAKRKLRLLVTGVEGLMIKGRRNGDPQRAVWVGFGAIDTLEIECPNPDEGTLSAAELLSARPSK